MQQCNSPLLIRGGGYSTRVINPPPLFNRTLLRCCTKPRLKPIKPVFTYNTSIHYTMSIFSRSISYYKTVRERNASATVPLGAFLRSPKHADKLERIRAAKTYNERRELKKKLLPAAAISGTFDGTGQAAQLVQHSGFICVDIDAKDNTHIEDLEAMPEFMRQRPEVAYVGRSASGKGFYVIFRVPDGLDAESHKRHFYGLDHAFYNVGIVLDTQPQAANAMRFYAYDPDAYFNEDATPWTETAAAPVPSANRQYLKANGTHPPEGFTTPAPAPKQSAPRASSFDRSKQGDALDTSELPVLKSGRLDIFGVILAKIERDRIDITSANNGIEGWKVWGNIARSIAGEYGRAGESYFHDISKYYPGYDSKETTARYNRALDELSSFPRSFNYVFKVAKDYGISYSAEMKMHREAIRAEAELADVQHLTPRVPDVPEAMPYPPDWDDVQPPAPGSAEHAEMIRHEADAAKIAKIIDVFDAVPE